jgi:hypothetical protein
MKKLAVLAMIAVMAMPVQAATYSDRFISFEYDDTTPSIIYYWGSSGAGMGFRYYIDPVEYTDDAATTSKVQIVVAEAEEIPSGEGAEVVSEDPYAVTWSYDDNGITRHALCKQLGSSEGHVSYVVIWYTDDKLGYDFCKQVYDTAIADPNTPMDARTTLVRNTLPFSPDIIPYIEQSIKLIDKGLNDEDSEFNLSMEAQRLNEKVDEIGLRSGYYFDHIASTFMPSKYDFSSISYSSLIDAKLTAQETLDILTE